MESARYPLQFFGRISEERHPPCQRFFLNSRFFSLQADRCQTCNPAFPKAVFFQDTVEAAGNFLSGYSLPAADSRRRVRSTL